MASQGENRALGLGMEEVKRPSILCCRPEAQECDDPESLRSETSLGSRNSDYGAGVGQRLVLEATKKATKERAEGKGVGLGTEAKSASLLSPHAQFSG